MSLSLLPLLLIFSLLTPTYGDCIPCRYGASTVTCPQPHGTDPKYAMTDFTCLCAKLTDYERVLSSCFKTKDLPSTCDPNDDSEHQRIREACKSVEVTTEAEEKNTKTETVEDTVVFTKSVKGGKETTLVESAKDGGVVTWTVTYYTSSSSSSGATPNTVIASDVTNTVDPVPKAKPSPEATRSGTGEDLPKDEGSGPNNGTVIGASVGAAVGVILVGIVAVELRKWSKRAENRRVEEEVKEAIRGVVRYGNADGPAELQEERAVVRVELPLSEKRYEMEG
jgi:hypothetical protein